MAILLSLGFWQLDRLDWKTNLIAERQARSQGPAAVLPSYIEDLDAWEYQRVRLTGRLAHDEALFLASRTRKGMVGRHVIVPFELTDGRILLLDRGWVPMPQAGGTDAGYTEPEGEMSLDAVVRRGGWRGSTWFKPDNDPQAGLWLWVDPSAMASALGRSGVIPDFYAQVIGDAEPGFYPAPAETKVEVRNDHLGYALTWFSLAGVLVVIFVIYHYRRD